MSNTVENERIQLSLPVNAAYVSAARLTASSIANRMGFDIDEIEDIKAAVSEACTYIIKQLNGTNKLDFKIIFDLKTDMLEITIKTHGKISMENLGSEMSMMMIKALMDKLNLSESDDKEFDMTVNMVKYHKQSTFDF